MKLKVAIASLLLMTALLRADQTLADAQQILKDQGFYYGEVSGEKNADTTAAIRRFQIRNGLQVNGELNEETLKALKMGSSGQPIAKATVAPRPDNSEVRSEPRQNAVTEEAPSATQPAPPPAAPDAAPAQQREAYPEREMEPGRPATEVQPGGIFAGTPYETAPPEVQQKVLLSAQGTLARRGLYRGPVDGVYGSNMEFSLRAYQARVGLPTTGRLDLETLAALELLPGAKVPIFTPRRPAFREPPVHGEWVRP